MSIIFEDNDEDIDYSDIPELDDAFWANAKLVCPPKRAHIPVIINEGLVNWFKQFGDDYQTQINAALVTYVEHVEASKLAKTTTST